MHIAPQPPTPDAAQDDRARRHARHQAILDTLIDQAAAIAARIAASATAATTPDTALPGAATAFDRITRCVRRTMALARHIEANPAKAARPDRVKARTRLIRAMEDAIHVQARNFGGDKDALAAEFKERLDDPALEFDVQGRDIGEVIQEIARDLGIADRLTARIWPRRTLQDVERLRTRAAAPASQRIAPLGAAAIQGTSTNPAVPPTPPHPTPS